jgi:hypothetical protein
MQCNVPNKSCILWYRWSNIALQIIGPPESRNGDAIHQAHVVSAGLVCRSLTVPAGQHSGDAIVRTCQVSGPLKCSICGLSCTNSIPGDWSCHSLDMVMCGLPTPASTPYTDGTILSFILFRLICWALICSPNWAPVGQCFDAPCIVTVRYNRAVEDRHRTSMPEGIGQARWHALAKLYYQTLLLLRDSVCNAPVPTQKHGNEICTMALHWNGC